MRPRPTRRRRQRRGRRPFGRLQKPLCIVGAVVVFAVGIASGVVSRSARERSASRPALTTTMPPASSVPASIPPTSPPAPQLGPSTKLSAAVSPIWAETPVGCISVVAGDITLYEANPATKVVPASVTKLLTAATALETLGADTRLRTSVRASGPPVSGVVTGDLWLVGGGDPVLGTNAWASQMPGQARPYTSLDTLADRVVGAGVRRVSGRVVGDETRYDADRYVDTWPTRLVTDGEAGPLSALVVNDGFRVWGHPGVPFSDPPSDAAGLFTRLLADRGVAVSGRPAAGTAAAEAVDIAVTDSPPVAQLVHAMLRDSDNGTAELLLKEIGLRTFRLGSTAAGARGVEDTLRRGGVPMDGVIIADGSGLSDAARLTCRAVTGLLIRRFADLYPRLPVGGRDGTLARRFVDIGGAIRAKTGSLDGTAALAGYADNASGATLSFAYIVNGLPEGASARRLQDELARAIVSTPP